MKTKDTGTLMMKYILLSIAAVTFVPLPVACADGPLFPFVISYDSPPNITNVSQWLNRPAGGQGFVRVGDGRLATDQGPIRFWATNLCFDACFVDRQQAEHLAARLARFGINCVRLHHMDARSIWGKSPNHLTIDPDKLARLDYLIYQLKQHGIYVDINLHVSRSFDLKDGFPHRDQRPKFDKGLDNFEPRMIALQKKYARDLLTHRNPFTQTAYAHEPAVAFVEINNENAMFSSWQRGWLDDLPDPYGSTYRELWNAWLAKKYRATKDLDAAWNSKREPLGDELLRDGHFTKLLPSTWRLEQDSETKAQWAMRANGPEGSEYLHLDVKQPGHVAWHPQISSAIFPVRKGRAYTLSCWLRAEQERTINLHCGMAHAPWQMLGFQTQIEVGPNWKNHQFTFLASQDDQRARITITHLKIGAYGFAHFSLRPGGITGLQANQRIEDASVPVLRFGQMNMTQTARNDFVDFLWDTEYSYWWGMYRYLKDELKVDSLVAGTQLGYGPTHIQAELDYLDSHSYWNHPVFPGRPWDGNDWYVRNVALVNSLGSTVTTLASRRVEGKPLTVSEYNHPAPNAYAAEGFPILAAFGAFQGWDGIFSFTYSHDTNLEPGRITSYFDLKGDTSKLVHSPACAALFLRGDVHIARKTICAGLSREKERDILYATRNPRDLAIDQLGIDSRIALLHRVSLDLHSTATPSKVSIPDKQRRFVSDTGQLIWDDTVPDAGYFIADTPRTKLFTGFVCGRSFRMGSVQLAIGKTRLDWATVSMVAIDGEGFSTTGRILIAATGWEQNSDAKVEDLGKQRITLRTKWGKAPLMCEGIPAKITLLVASGRVRVFPLDESGNRRKPMECQADGRRTIIALDPKYQTVWYEVEIR